MPGSSVSLATPAGPLTTSITKDTASTATAVPLKASAAVVHAIICDNTAGSAAVYPQLFDIASPTLGSDTPELWFKVPAGKVIGLIFRNMTTDAGVANFGTALTLATTTSPGNNTAPSGTKPTVRVFFT